MRGRLLDEHISHQNIDHQSISYLPPPLAFRLRSFAKFLDNFFVSCSYSPDTCATPSPTHALYDNALSSQLTKQVSPLSADDVKRLETATTKAKKESLIRTGNVGMRKHYDHGWKNVFLWTFPNANTWKWNVAGLRELESLTIVSSTIMQEDCNHEDPWYMDTESPALHAKQS